MGDLAFGCVSAEEEKGKVGDGGDSAKEKK
jgi:hypothetical protein